VAESFDLMVENLILLIRNLKDTSGEIFKAAQNLSATSQEMNAATEEIAVANARLIAAAPDLLTALRNAMLAIEAAGTHIPDASEADILCAAAYRLARATIDKATGD